MVRTLLIILGMCFSLFLFVEITGEKEREVWLEGNFGENKEAPLKVLVKGTLMKVFSSAKIDDVAIAVVGDDGVVESRTVSMNVGQMEIFNLEGCAVGTYRIRCTTPLGMYLNGEFSIRN